MTSLVDTASTMKGTYHRRYRIPYRRPPLCFTSFGVVDRDRVSMPSMIADSCTLDFTFTVWCTFLSSSWLSSGASLHAHASVSSPLFNAVNTNDKMHAGLGNDQSVSNGSEVG